MCTKYEAQIASSVVTSFSSLCIINGIRVLYFETIGYTPLAISILLLTFIPTAVMLKNSRRHCHEFSYCYASIFIEANYMAYSWK